MKNQVKITLLSLIVALFSFSNLSAQNQKGNDWDDAKSKERKEKMQEMRNNFILKHVELSASESSKLAEINKKYDDLMMQNRKAQKENKKNMKEKNVSALTEVEAKAFLKKEMEHQEKMLALKKQKQDELLQQFSAVKVLEIQRAEKKFKHEAMQRHVKNKK